MIELTESSVRQYAFTLRRTNLKKGVTVQQYMDHVLKWQFQGKCKLVAGCFEHTAGLHMHGILEIPKAYNKKKFFRVRGWNIKLEEIYDLEGWKYYMLKEQHCQEQFDDESWIDDQPSPEIKYSLFKKGGTASDSA